MNLPRMRHGAWSAAGLVVCLAVAALGSFVLQARAPEPVAASSGGKIGFSGNPGQAGVTCAKCHHGGTAPMVKISGPDVVAPGSTNAFTLTISGGQKVAGGLDVSTTGGMLRVPLGNDDVQESSGEITHLRPKNADANGDVIFHFLWSAPAQTGRATFYGAGNSVDLSGDNSGDAPATDTFRVAIGDGSEPTETPGPTPFVTTEPTTPAPPSPTETLTPTVTPAEPTAKPEGSVVYLPLARRGGT